MIFPFNFQRKFRASAFSEDFAVTRSPSLFRRPRHRRTRWGAFAERMAHQAVSNGRVYIIAAQALARARRV